MPTIRLTDAEFWTLYFDAGNAEGPWPPPVGPTAEAREGYQRKLTQHANNIICQCWNEGQYGRVHREDCPTHG